MADNLLMADYLSSRRPRRVSLIREETPEEAEKRKNAMNPNPFPNTTDTLRLAEILGGSNNNPSSGNSGRSPSFSNLLDMKKLMGGSGAGGVAIGDIGLGTGAAVPAMDIGVAGAGGAMGPAIGDIGLGTGTAAPAMDVGVGSSGSSGLGGFMAGPWAGLGGLAGLGLAAYLGYQQGESDLAGWEQEDRTDPNRILGRKFAEDHPEAFTSAGVPQNVDLGQIPFYSGSRWNPETRRFEAHNIPYATNGMPMDEVQRLYDKQKQYTDRGD